MQQRSPLPPERKSGAVTPHEKSASETERSGSAGPSPRKDKVLKRKIKAKKKKLVLFLVDPQCDYLEDGGSMPIINAAADGTRIADMIMTHLSDIHEIYVSLNSRHRTHISNPISWVCSTGEAPEPYTIISKADVLARKYRARVPTLQRSYLEYVAALEALGRDALVLWPDHCLMGTEGVAVIPEINDALQEWASHNMTTVEYIIKGTNCGTEMYSALSAEVPSSADPSTQLDHEMVARLATADRVLVAGLPLTHAVKHTLGDMLRAWRKPNPNPDKTNSIYLLQDCSSALPGEEMQEDLFLQQIGESGVTLATSTAFSTFHFLTPEEIAEQEAALLRATLAAEAKIVAIAAKKAAKAAAAAAAAAAAEEERLKRLAEKKARRAAKKAAAKAAAEALRLKKLEEERLEAIRQQRLEEERLARLKKEKAEKEERQRIVAEEEAARQLKLAEEAEAARKKAEAEEAARRRAMEEEAARVKAAEEEVARIQKAKEDEEARIKKEAEEEEARIEAEKQARIAAFKAECENMRESFIALADEALCDNILTQLIPQLSAASVPLRAHVFAEMTGPDAASALVNCLTLAAAKASSEYTEGCEQRMLKILALVVQFLQCDGYANELEPPATKVHMSGLKDRQLTLVKAEVSEVLFTILALGPKASDELYAATARVLGLICCATDMRAAGSPVKAKKAGKKPKTHVNSFCQEGFVPYSKSLLAQLKVHGERKESSALSSLCEVILHIGLENPATQRRLLDLQAVGLLAEQLKLLPTSYADISDDAPANGDPSPRQIIISQKSHVVQAIKMILEPSHRRSKVINGKVLKAAESMRDSADEDADIKATAEEICAKFAAVVAAALGSPRESDASASEGEGDDSPRLQRKESKKEKRERLKREATEGSVKNVPIEPIAEDESPVKVDPANPVITEEGEVDASK